jgi:cyclase
MKRIIARLDIKGPNLVKGIHLEGLRVLGSPSLFARSYYESGVDELFYQDVVASLYDRNGLFDLIKSVAKETFIPLTVSGGIRTLGDIKRALRHGADKVCINTGAFQNTEFIKNAALEYGSSTIVVAIEAIKQKGSSYLAYTDNGREHTGVDVLKWAQEVSELGAGEIILTSIDNEGTGKGYDCELTKKVSDLVSIPVIAHGGAGKLEHIKDVIQDGSADAVAIASLFHYGLARYDEEFTRGSSEGNLEFLKKKNFSLFQTATVQDVKKYLLENNIKVRAM